MSSLLCIGKLENKADKILLPRSCVIVNKIHICGGFAEILLGNY